MENHRDVKHHPDANPDPITGQKGAHPVGTGTGAASVGVAGTVVGGAIGGPVGAVAGAVVGSAAGGLIGKSVAEEIDPTLEDTYWRTHYRSRSYVRSDYDYDNDYSPAYRTGYEGYPRYAKEGMTYADAEPHLRKDYEKRRGHSRLGWDQAKYATREAWNRVDSSVHDRSQHDTYWRQNYRSRPYVEAGQHYDLYAPAYGLGYSSYLTYRRDRNMSYKEAEPHIRERYERHHGGHHLGWEKTKLAIQDAWHRLTDSDRGRHENDEYWRTNYSSRPYFESNREYERYAPAYRLGYDSYTTFGRDRGMTYEEAEPMIHKAYERRHQNHDLNWEHAKQAIRDVWDRLTDMVSDNDRHKDHYNNHHRNEL